MTDNEIIKALECCAKETADCENCPANREFEYRQCFDEVKILAVDLINRQKAEIESHIADLGKKDAEIERLTKFLTERRNCAYCKYREKKPYEEPCDMCKGYDLYEQSTTEKEIKTEAYKEFAELLKSNWIGNHYYCED
jgi:hypothetical protein